MIDALLLGEKETLSVTITKRLKTALQDDAAEDGFGGSRQFSRYVEQVILKGLKTRRAEREAERAELKRGK